MARLVHLAEKVGVSLGEEDGFRLPACRYGSVLGRIHIHKGEGIGVGKFFGLFSVSDFST